jgi:hypothetical protein
MAFRLDLVDHVHREVTGAFATNESSGIGCKKGHPLVLRFEPTVDDFELYRKISEQVIRGTWETDHGLLGLASLHVDTSPTRLPRVLWCRWAQVVRWLNSHDNKYFQDKRKIIDGRQLFSFSSFGSIKSVPARAVWLLLCFSSVC